MAQIYPTNTSTGLCDRPRWRFLSFVVCNTPFTSSARRAHLVNIPVKSFEFRVSCLETRIGGQDVLETCDSKPRTQDRDTSDPSRDVARSYKCLLSQFHTCPETSRSCARYMTVRAVSSSDVGRRRAWSGQPVPSGKTPSVRRVFCQPGKMRLTRMLCAPHSHAAVLTKPMSPAFDVA